MTIKRNNKERIFSAAAELDADQRNAFLDAACGNDDQLRAEVESLLRHDGHASGLIDRPAVQPPATDLFRPITEGPGTIIGPYKLLQQIGEGGFGVVYMAEQQRPVRRKVALKIIKPGMDTREVIARFESERQALALMDHPNIARVLDAGATDSGRPYFVMELVKGVPITEYCDKNTLPTEKRLALFITICHAVQHAHQKGVIHRDLKPSNVMVTLHDGHPVPKVIDFGVSKATSQQLTEKTLFTAYGQMIGTPAYMSPEQAEMSGLDIDTRSDLYSLGVLLYELLTGTTPFDGKRLREAGYIEMQRIIREEAPPRPSTRVSTLGEALTILSTQRSTDPKKLGQQLRGDLDVIVMKALEKERSRRYDTPNAFADDIQRFLNHEAIVARPASTAYRLKKFVQRNVAAVAAISAIAAALIFGTVTSTWLAIRESHASRLAQSERAKAEKSLIEAVTAKSDAERQRDRAEKAKAEESKQAQLALEQKQAAEAAEKTAATERTAAVQERDKATAASAELAKQKEQQRRLLYVAQMNLIQKAWSDDNVPRVQELLNASRPRPGETDLRSIEWHYWQRMLHQEERSFRLPMRLPEATRGFGGSTGASAELTSTSAFLSSDGTRLAAIVPDNTVRERVYVLKVWDTATGAVEPVFSRELLRLPATGELSGRGTTFGSRPFSSPHTIAFLDSQRVVLAHLYSRTPADTRDVLERIRNATAEERAELAPELLRQRQASTETVLQTFELTSPIDASQAPTSFNVGSLYVFSTDGSRLATLTLGAPATESPSDTISILDGRTGEKLDQFPSPFRRLTLCAISNGGQRLAIAELPPPALGRGGGPTPLPTPQVMILQRESRDSVALQPQANSDNLSRATFRAKWEFSPDSTQLALAGSRTALASVGLMLFDATSGRELPISMGAQHNAFPTGLPESAILAFSPDGKWLATTAGDPGQHKLVLWETATGQPGPEIKGHTAAPTLAAFSADSSRLLTADEHGFVKVWNVTHWAATGLPSREDIQARFLNRVNSPWNVPSPDGRWTAVAPRASPQSGFGSTEVKLEPSYELKLIDKSGRVPPRVIALPGPAHSLEFSPDNSLLASVAIDPVANLDEAVELRIWNVATGEPLAVSIPRFLATEITGSRGRGSPPPTSKSANSPTPQQPSRRTTSTAPPVFSPDGRWLAAGFLRRASDGSISPSHIYMLDIQQRREIPLAIPHLPGYSHPGGSNSPLRFSPDSKLLLTSSEQISRTGPGFGPPQVRSQAFHVVAAATGVFLWQTSSTLANSVAFSADSQRLAAIEIPPPGSGNSQQSAVVMWEANTGKVLNRIELPPNRVFNSLAISPSGDRAAAQSPGGVTVYDVATEKVLYSLEGVPTQIKFTSDGQRLITAAPITSSFPFGNPPRGFPGGFSSPFESSRTSGGDAKVWDAVTGQELLSFSAESPLYTEFRTSGVTSGFAPLAPQVEAESIVDWLSAADANGQFLSRVEIAERIQNDPSLTAAARAIALQLAAKRLRPVYALANPAVEVLHTIGLPREAYQRALEWLAEAIEQSPEEGTLFSRQGLAHYRLGDYSAALASLERSVKLRSAVNLPPLADTLAFLAMTHHQLGHADQARQFFYQTEREYLSAVRQRNSSSGPRGFPRGVGAPAEDSDPLSATTASAFDSLNEAAALLGLKKYSDHITEGISLRTKKEYEQALAQYDAAIALDPENPEAYLERARTWRLKSDFEKMIADASTAIRLDPKYHDAYNLRGIGWSTKREYVKAIEDYTQAIKLEPRNATYLGNRGNDLARSREYERAITDLTAALNINPNNALHYSFRAFALEGKREYAKALPDYDEAIRLGIKDAATYAGRGRVHHNLGARDKGLADLQQAIDLSSGPSAAPHYRTRAALHTAAQKNDLAIQDHSEAIRLAPNDSDHSNRGGCFMRIGELDKALADFEEALRRIPNNSANIGNRGAVRTMLGHYAAALADLDEALRLDPKAAALRFWRGYLFQKQGQHDQAKQEQDEFLKMFPTPADGLRDRGDRWLTWGEYANAIADYEQLLALEPENIVQRNNYAWILATCPDEKLRNGQKSLELATHAAELTESKLYSVLDTLAAAHAQLGNFPAAITFAEKALPFAPAHEKPLIESHLALYRDYKPYREPPIFNPAPAQSQR